MTKLTHITDKEIAYVKKHQDWPTSKLVIKLDRSKRTIVKIKGILGIKRKWKRKTTNSST